jgi:hypothetical protein
METTGPLKFLGNPPVSTPCSRDPGRTDDIRPYDATDAAPVMQTTKATHDEVFSGLNHTASTLAVYASPAVSLQKTPDALSAVGQTLRNGIGYPQGSYERFP